MPSAIHTVHRPIFKFYHSQSTDEPTKRHSLQRLRVRVDSPSFHSLPPPLRELLSSRHPSHSGRLSSSITSYSKSSSGGNQPFGTCTDFPSQGGHPASCMESSHFISGPYPFAMARFSSSWNFS